MDLPDEVLDDVLRRVPPRRLAACRRVCRSWRDVIDVRGLVLAHLAPGPVRGMFVNFTDKRIHGFFSRGAVAAALSPSIDGSLMFLPSTHAARSRVLDHCNGLLLCQNNKATYICNPATRRWATLPPRPLHPTAGPRFYRDRLHLLFDPTVSLHYRVMFFPEAPGMPMPPHRNDLPRKRSRYRPTYVGSKSYCIEKMPPSLRASYEQEVDNVGSMEWPPYSYVLQVFSSETGLWDERCFVRQGDAVTTVSEIWYNVYAPTYGRPIRCYAAVYWQGAFYLNCPGGFIVRFSLREDKYTAIKTPRLEGTFFGQLMPLTDEYGERSGIPHIYLAKSKEGIYYAALHGYRLQIWILHGASESCQMPEWELSHQVDFTAAFLRHTLHHTREDIGMSWILTPGEEISNNGGDHGWDSSDDCTIDPRDRTTRNNDASTKHDYGVNLLGYHPYREITFLASGYNAFAYYLGSSKLQYLGRLYPTRLGRFENKIITYIYTPCNDDLLPAQNDLG
ncbi:hypothetical protein ACQ4PT_010072 [Festuca glaucescens]